MEQRPWTVLKFGGTSVSSPECWDRIAERIRALSSGHRVWVVASAVSQVSNRLECAIDEALAGNGEASLRWIASRHRQFATELGLESGECEPVEDLLDDLTRLLEGIRLTGEAPPRLRARVLSFGELASTRLGVPALARRGVDASFVDARRVLRSTPRSGEKDSARYLEARIQPRKDPGPVESTAGGAGVVLTQGFLAETAHGETCLLGRGGSDTSAALFAALLGADGAEVWTDVHGMFTADPRQIPSARLIRRIGFREAQELAAMGAKVLHPRCLEPLSWSGIPLTVRNTFDAEAEGTRIAPESGDDPVVMAVVCRTGVTLLNLATLEMWQTSGFLARAFAPFDEAGVSVDLVATSQSAVSVTLDRVAGGIEGRQFQGLLERLRELGTVQVIHPCAVVSIVGRRIRTVLHELGPAMAVFREHEVHLVSESSEDLNLSFVVNESDARPLVRELHSRLFSPQASPAEDPRFGPTWELLKSRAASPGGAGAVAEARTGPPIPVGEGAWWYVRRDELLERCADGRARYVYDLDTVRARATALRREVPSVGEWFYSMKANPRAEILEALAGQGFGLECVSAGEILHARKVAGPEVPLLFTPNFCPLDEYAVAREHGAELTIDGPEVLEQAPEMFRGSQVGLRVDTGAGLGHHPKVRTAGPDAKFGHLIDDVERVAHAAARLDVTVIGLHAHVGSGIFDPRVWTRVGEQLAARRRHFPALRWIDLGGGLGVVERPGQAPLDLATVETGVSNLARELDGIALRMEPGRFLVSEAGVMLAPVTQVRTKGNMRLVGVATGMNSLLRPALYGAWHAIHNLTRIDERPDGYAHVVGPICESGDVLGRDRLLPETRPGDVLLVENCGAYGAAMASRYNLREPASEIVLDGARPRD